MQQIMHSLVCANSSMDILAPVATLQKLTTGLLAWPLTLLLVQANVLPSGLNASDITPPASRVQVFLPVATSNNLTPSGRRPATPKPPLLPAARVLPSGLNFTVCTPPTLRIAVFLPLATSHSLAVLSSPAEARVLPSELNATDRTTAMWAVVGEKVQPSSFAWEVRL